MTLTIGLTHNSRELKVVTDLDEKAIRTLLQEAGEDFVEFQLENEGTILINPSAIAYVEFGTGKSRSVGFGMS